MAFTDNLNELWGIPELEAQKERAIQLVREYLQEVTAASKKMRSLQFGIGGMENMAQMKANAKEVETLTNQQIKSIKALADAKLKEAKAEEALSRARLNAAKEVALADKKETATKKDLERQTKAAAKAQEDLTKKQEKATADAGKANNAYELLKKQYREAANEAKRLGAELGVDDARFKASAASAHAMHTQLLNIEMSVGQAQRQVGNYNVVGMQFNQLLRELPNAGISARTFVMAISNNITYFAEAVQTARKEGASWGSVLGMMGKSLFSVVGIMNIAITVFTLLAMNTGKAADETENLTEKTDELTISLRELTDQYSQLSKNRRLVSDTGSEQAKRELDLAKAQGKSASELLKLSDEYRKKKKAELTEEKQLYDNVTNSLYNYAESILESKNAQQASEQLVKNVMLNLKVSREEAMKAISEVQGEALGLMFAGTDVDELNYTNFKSLQEFAQRSIDLSENIKDLDNENEIDKATTKKKIYEQSLKDREKAYRKHMDAMRNAEKERGAPALMPTTEDINQQIKEYENQNLANRLQTAIFGNEQDEKKALTALENQFAQGLISAKDYEAERLRIQNDFATQRIQLEIDTTKKLLANGGMAEDERLKLIARISDLELELAQQGNDKKLKAEQEYNKASIKAEEERAQQIRNIRQQLLQAAVQFSGTLLERELENIREGREALEDNKQVELARIEATSKTEEEATQRKLAFEVSYAARKEELRKNEEQARRRQFYIEKAAAITGIIVDSAQKTAALQAAAEVAHASSVAAYAGIPYVGVGLGQSQGAALRASILAQIPSIQLQAGISAALIGASVLAYAEGTPEGGHRGGAAVVGEAGEAEYVKEPGKAGYWVTKPTYFKSMTAGTEVTPLHKLEAGGLDTIDGRALNAIMLQGAGNSAKTEALLAEAVGKLGNIEKKPQSQWIVKGNAMYEIVTKGTATNKKLGSRFID